MPELNVEQAYKILQAAMSEDRAMFGERPHTHWIGVVGTAINIHAACVHSEATGIKVSKDQLDGMKAMLIGMAMSFLECRPELSRVLDE